VGPGLPDPPQTLLAAFRDPLVSFLIEKPHPPRMGEVMQPIQWTPPVLSLLRAAKPPPTGPVPLARARSPSVPDLIIDLSTVTAWTASLGTSLADILAARIELDEDLRFDITMALSEATTNALMHGNLDMQGGPAAGLRARDPLAFSQAIEERLADPAFLNRRITLAVYMQPGSIGRPGTIRISVTDQGRGFNAEMAVARSTTAGQALTGRGLALIRELAKAVLFDDSGRRIVMSFDCPQMTQKI
jgi:anti-sigma regulatory factor (Ser/Thr protein kinase)